jgi:hypothetical protein
MVESSHERIGWLRWRLAPAALVCACLMLGGCSSFSSYVSDRWPTWAGGMPSDIPPRPGEPGYAEFISHQEAKDEAAAAAANKPGASSTVTSGPTGAVATPAVAAIPAGAAPAAAGNVNAQPLPPDARRIDTQAAVQGGLY